jgi:hypothetical protein
VEEQKTDLSDKLDDCRGRKRLSWDRKLMTDHPILKLDRVSILEENGGRKSRKTRSRRKRRKRRRKSRRSDRKPIEHLRSIL